MTRINGRRTVGALRTACLALAGAALSAAEPVDHDDDLLLPPLPNPFAAEAPAATPAATTARPVARYDFSQVTEDGRVPDTAAVYPDMDLVVRGASIPAVQVADGILILMPPAQSQPPGLFSPGPAKTLVAAIMATGRFSIEVWAQAADANQHGPARMVSISQDTAARNVTLGQEGGQYVLRLRTTATDHQGMPELRTPEGSVDPDRCQHLVVTFDGTTAALHVDGQRVAESDRPAGSLEGWSEEMPLAIGNEATGDRPWRGRMRLVAIYAHPLSAAEIHAAHAAGPIP